MVARASVWSTTGQGRCTLTGLRHSNRHRVFPACSRLLALASCALPRATTGPLRHGACASETPGESRLRTGRGLLWKDRHGAGGQRLARWRPGPRRLPANRGQRVKETLNTILLRHCSVTLTWRKRKALPTRRSAADNRSERQAIIKASRRDHWPQRAGNRIVCRAPPARQERRPGLPTDAIDGQPRDGGCRWRFRVPKRAHDSGNGQHGHETRGPCASSCVCRLGRQPIRVVGVAGIASGCLRRRGGTGQA